MDGEAVEIPAGAPRELQLDVEHRYELLLQAPGYETATLEITLALDERHLASVRLTRFQPLEESPVLWTILGSVLLAGAVAGIVGGYFAAQLQPTGGHMAVAFP